MWRKQKNNFKIINYIYILIFFTWIFLFLNYSFNKEKQVIDPLLNTKKSLSPKSSLPFREKGLLKKEKNIYEKFDLDNDDSIQKFMNNKISFKNKNYSPKNLENVRHIFIYSTKDNSAVLRKEAQKALKKMSIEFWANFEGNKIKVISGYRSFEEQKRIEESWACEKKLCAKAGYSEHQTGLAVDLFLVDWDLEKEPEIKEYFAWMQKNAHNFWFTNTYIKWKEIDWYAKEPWHWRYVWVELASYLKQQDMSFAEFYEEAKK